MGNHNPDEARHGESGNKFTDSLSAICATLFRFSNRLLASVPDNWLMAFFDKSRHHLKSHFPQPYISKLHGMYSIALPRTKNLFCLFPIFRMSFSFHPVPPFNTPKILFFKCRLL